jgi:phage/plasmid-associated DNA primase
LARSATISEFDPKIKINDKQLKNLTGGDVNFFIGKFKTGENRISHMTIETFSNDPPTFTTIPANDFALKRRLALLPTRARFLGPNDDEERNKLKIDGHSDWIFQKNEAFVANVLTNGVPAFLAFAVEGARKILGRRNYDIEMPPTIRNATEREYGRDKSDMLKDFVKSELRQSQSSFVSTAEIIQVYKKLYDLESCLIKSGVFATQLKTAIKDVFFGFAASDGFMVDDCKKRVASPEGRKEVRGYLNVDWVPERQAAEIAAELRKTYFS